MSTNHYPAVVNSNGPLVSSCPTKKKQFSTSSLAETFASELAVKYPQNARQTAYACEECPMWHLSTMDTAAHSMVESRSNLSSSAKQTYAQGLHSALQHLQTKIKETYTEEVRKNGLHAAVARTCKQLEIDDAKIPNVRTWLVELGLHKVNTRNTSSVATPWGTPKNTVEAIETQEQSLERQLQELKAKKQALIELKNLKISTTIDNNGVILRKEGNVLVLAFNDAYDMIEKLTAYLAANAPKD